MQTRPLLLLTYLLFILVTSQCPLWAEGINKEQALKIAENKLSERGTSVLAKTLTITNEQPATKGTTEPLYYVVQDPAGGFVIVSNETSTAPILAYSYSGTFSLEDAPDALKSWMGALAEGIADMKNKNVAQSPTIKRQWEQAAVRTKAGTGNDGQILLETALWNQGNPYNDQCPIINGKTAPTGCGPTAMAIIMRYWKCPAIAPFSYIEPYSFYVNNQEYQNGGWTIDYDYDWDNMPLTTKEIDTPEKIRAISTLMRDCGAIAQAAYRENVTSTYVSSYITLKYLLGFDKSAREIQWNEVPNDEWQATLNNEIRQGRPVLFTGTDYYTGGHAFVGDGVDADGNMRMNWGWGGLSNGFYSLAPFGYENETREPRYFDTMVAFINLEPDKGSPNEPAPFVTRMFIQEGAVTQNVPFHVSIDEIFVENGRFKFPLSKMILSVFNKNKQLKEYISDEFSRHNNAFHECVITKPIETGDYIEVLYRYHDEDQWKPVRHEGEFCEGFIILKDEITLQEFTQIIIGRKVEPRKYGALSPRQTSIIQVSTKRGSRIGLYNEQGKLLCNDSRYSTIFEDGPAIGPYCIWEGDKDIPDRDVYHIYLSELPKGKYTIKLIRHLETAEFTFEL